MEMSLRLAKCSFVFVAEGLYGGSRTTEAGKV